MRWVAIRDETNHTHVRYNRLKAEDGGISYSGACTYVQISICISPCVGDERRR
jgi:hypothetical protein